MGDDTPTRFRSSDELSPEERAEFDRALDSGVTELPPNEVKGILGEYGMDVRKVEDFSPDLNAGLSQEYDPGLQSLVIVLAFLIFFPVGYVLLWRDKHLTRRTKWITSVVVAAIVVPIVFALMRG
jgi:hypothetical protein